MHRRMLVLMAPAAIVLGAMLSAANLQLSSPAFPPNGQIPVKYTCDGDSINPPLVFNAVPPNAQSLALIVEDPDVPKNLRPSGVFDHWLVWDLPADSKGIPESAGKIGISGSGKPGFVGPCPPDREHRYFFKLYALDTKLTGAKIANKQELESLMEGHIIDRAELVGRYDRHKK